MMEKRGAQYHYPDSYIQLLGYMRAYFHLHYRQEEGVVLAHAAKKIPSIPNYIIIRCFVRSYHLKDQPHLQELFHGQEKIILVDISEYSAYCFLQHKINCIFIVPSIIFWGLYYNMLLHYFFKSFLQLLTLYIM